MYNHTHLECGILNDFKERVRWSFSNTTPNEQTRRVTLPILEALEENKAISFNNNGNNKSVTSYFSNCNVVNTDIDTCVLVNTIITGHPSKSSKHLSQLQNKNNSFNSTSNINRLHNNTINIALDNCNSKNNTPYINKVNRNLNNNICTNQSITNHNTSKIHDQIHVSLSSVSSYSTIHSPISEPYNVNKLETISLSRNTLRNSTKGINMHRPKDSNIHRSTTYNTSTNSDINQPAKPNSAENNNLIRNIITKIVKYFSKAKLRSFIKIILNTGVTKHMTGNTDLFAKIPPVTNKFVILGDGTTKHPVLGIGIIHVNIGNYFIQLHDVLYVPQLQDTLFSITEHIKY